MTDTPRLEIPKPLADYLDHVDDNRSYSAKIVTHEATISALLKRAEQAEAREKALKDSTAELRQLRRDHNDLLAQRERDAEVRVKPLEWRPTTIDGKHLRDTAADMDGKLRYEVGVTPGHHYLMINRPTGGLESRGNYPSADDAKAAAQENYERRILSALAARDARR